jgi:C-3',4' desaturase CrtD
MTYEVVVVGGGIGGLTAAALLAARGADVCLLERESNLGGSASSFQKFGCTFDDGLGLYAGWQPSGVHQRIFAELPVKAPEVRALNPAYVVRLPDHSQVAITADSEQFEDNLRAVFPECADKAVGFYRTIAPLSRSLSSALRKVPDLKTASKVRQLSAFLPDARRALQLRKLANDTAAQHIAGTSARFRRFLDVQLQALAQSSTDDCSYLYASVILDTPRDSLFTIKGGVSALAETLAESIKESGGKIRLNTPVLRLAYDSSGRATGVDLLSGETVEASKAVISNLTIWDTYGKLVGLSRTPNEIRKQMTSLRGTGAYLVYAALEECAVERLPAEHILTLADWRENQTYDEQSQLSIGISPRWDPSAPSAKRAVTIQAFTDVDEWFTFHEDESEHENRDQLTMEACWQRLHAALPELGGDIEVIDTATPRTFYEQTRRKLGMVGTVREMSMPSGPYPSPLLSHLTSVPNLFRVGDTAFPGAGIAAVSHSALIAANEISA